MANNITHSNWADYFATTPTDWTFDNTNRVYQYTGSEVYITFDVDFDDDIPSPNTPNTCLLYTSPSPRDRQKSRMPSSA